MSVAAETTADAALLHGFPLTGFTSFDESTSSPSAAARFVVGANLTLNKAIFDLFAISRLPQNWDSHGARSIASNSIATAFQVLKTVVSSATPEAWIVPTNRGGVQIEWHTTGLDIEIEINPDGENFVSIETVETVVEDLPLTPTVVAWLRSCVLPALRAS